MRRSLFLAGLIIYVLSGCAIAEQPNPQPPPAPAQETPDASVWDFGRVPQGEKGKHSFVLKNATQKDLTIIDVHASCGCTTAAVEKKALAPGEETQIEVTFNSSGYSGAIQQFVYVRTDDLDNPIVRYIIKADVVK